MPSSVSLSLHRRHDTHQNNYNIVYLKGLKRDSPPAVTSFCTRRANFSFRPWFHTQKADGFSDGFWKCSKFSSCNLWKSNNIVPCTCECVQQKSQGGTVLIVKYFDAYFQKDNSPWGLTPETVKLSLNICHADISQLCSPTLADAVNHESFSNIYYAAFYLCSWIGGEGQKPWQKPPPKRPDLAGDHRSAVSRWQQRAWAKRIYLVANAAGILPSDVRKSPPPTALPNWAPTGSLLGCSHAKWLQNKRSDIMLSKTRTKSAR